MSRFYNGSGYGTSNVSVEILNFTLSVWVKLQEAGTVDRTIFSYRNQTTAGADRAGFILSITASEEIKFTSANNTTSVSAVTTAADGLANRINEWVHIYAAEVAGLNRVIYVDGVFKASNSTAITFNSNPTPTAQIGAQIHSNTTVINPWLGYIHQPAVWTSSISEYNIALLAAGANPNNAPFTKPLYFADRTISNAIDSRSSTAYFANSALTTYIDGAYNVQDVPTQTLKYTTYKPQKVYSFPTESINILNFERSPIRGVARGVS